MKITKRQLHRYINRVLSERAPLKDPLAHKDPADVIHATHAAWAGGNAGEVEDENLVLPIDHSVAAGGEATTKEPEMLPRQENLVSERRLRMTIRKIVREALLLEEPSDYYKDYRAGTITREEYEDLVRQYEERESGYKRRPAKTTYVGSGANTAKIAAVEDALSKKSNNFLTSILRQLKSGRGLSAKQNSIVKKILAKTDVKAAELFDGRPTKAPTKPSRPEPKWKGTKDELTQKVHQYLIDIGFYRGVKGRDGKMYVDPFSKGAHPKGGYTSNIPKVLKAGIASGEIDWATYDEMDYVYRAIDRSID